MDMHLTVPLWLRIVCSIDTLLFGPFYAASLYAFATGRHTQRWYRLLAPPLAGALLYSTIVVRLVKDTNLPTQFLLRATLTHDLDVR